MIIFILLKRAIPKLLAILICVSLISCGSSSSENTNSNSSSSDQLNRILNDFVQQYAESQYFSAISATVECGNSAPINGIAGTMESNGVIPITTSGLFQIGSITKSFTSIVILQLAADPSNNFSLNDTVGHWLKNLDGTSTYPQWDNITIKQLLNMSSGIQSYLTPPMVLKALESPEYYISPEEIVSAVESLPSVFTPGNGYDYSNTNYILLGMLIQKITGNTPILEIQNRIFKVLNLTHTYLPANLPASVIPINDMVNGYLYYHDIPDPYSYLDGFYNPTWNSMSFYYTAGGIISTPEDINRYLHALFHPGLLLTESEFNSLTTDMIDKESSSGFPNGGEPITGVSESHTNGYGLGIMSSYVALPTGSYYYYQGGTFGYSFTYYYFPVLNMYMSFAVNNSVDFYGNPNSSTSLINSIFQYVVTTICHESSIPSPFVPSLNWPINDETYFNSLSGSERSVLFETK